MRQTTEQELTKRFDPETRVRVWIKGVRYGLFGDRKTPKNPPIYKLKNVPWHMTERVTVLFDKPKSYLLDGDECLRDGVAYHVTNALPRPHEQSGSRNERKKSRT